MLGFRISFRDSGTHSFFDDGTAHWFWRDCERYHSVTLVRSGGSRDRFTALQNGLIDATVLTGAFVERAKAADSRCCSTLPIYIFPTVSMMTTRSFQSSKRFIVRSFLQALGEAISVFKHDPVLAKKTLAKMDAHPRFSFARQRLQQLLAENLSTALQPTHGDSDRRR
jgi:hypothetical protein